MENQIWVLCPLCNNKTRTKNIGRYGTAKFSFVLSEMQNGNFNQYKEWEVTVIKEPDAKTQSR